MKYLLNLTSKVMEKFAGETLLESLTRRFTYRDAQYWNDKILAGQILIDELPASPDRVLCVGETVRFMVPDFEEPDLDTDYQKVFENDNIIIVSKPADLPVHSNRRFYFQTMTAILRRHENLENLNPMHRLDRETSGLMIFMKKNFQRRRYRRNPAMIIKKKLYLAIVKGHISQSSFEVNEPLAESGQLPVRYKMIITPEGKPAETRFYLAAVSETHSLLVADLITGRKHQIRAHLEHIGHPIIGDKLYSHGGLYFMKRCEDNLQQSDLEELGAPHQLLHSWCINLALPDTDQQMIFAHQLPRAFDDYLKKLEDWQPKAMQIAKDIQSRS